MRTASFDLDDFLQQFKMLKRMGPLQNVLGMLPGMDKLKDSSIDEGQLKRVEAIILSMTPAGAGASGYSERAPPPAGRPRQRYHASPR